MHLQQPLVGVRGAAASADVERQGVLYEPRELLVLRQAEAGASITRTGLKHQPQPQTVRRVRSLTVTPESHWGERVFDEFWSQFLGLSTGNGSVSQGGGTLNFTVGAVNCRPIDLCPLASTDVHNLMVAFDTILRFDCRCYSAPAGGVAVHEGLILGKNLRSDAYTLYNYSYETKIYAQRWISGGASTLGSTGNVAQPSTSPHTYRMYWNPTSRPLFIPEVNSVIDANQVLFYYRVGDSASFTYLVSRTMDWKAEELHVGVFVGNVSVAGSASFSHLSICQMDARTQKFLPVNTQVTFL